MTFEELLNRDGILTYKTKGTSMEPMLRQDRDLVTIRKKDPAKRCSENDVVLYRYPDNHKYILHRIIEVRESDYVILGDNCICPEYGIRDADILGVLVSFVQDGKQTDVNDADYLRYVSRLRQTQEKRIQSKKRKMAVKATVKKIIRYNRWKRYIGR